MIDPTPQQSAAYSKLIEAEGPSELDIELKAREVLRGLSALDIGDALHDLADRLRVQAVLKLDPALTGSMVQKALWDYCQSIAKRELEA